MGWDNEPIVAIDPGIEGGWAWFPAKSHVPLLCGVFSLSGKEGEGVEFHRRTVQVVDQLFDKLEQNIRPFKPNRVYCEWPVIFKAGGSMAAEGSGSLIKLAYWVGHFSGVLSQRWPDVEFVPVEVNKWKGNLPKKIVEARLRRILDPRWVERVKPVSHAWDAIGIGLWARGVF